jgi:hypothetical protein
MFDPSNQYYKKMKTNTSILKVLFLFIVSSLLYTSCSYDKSAPDFESIAVESTGETPSFKSVAFQEQENTTTQVEQPNIKIIRNATLKVKVNDVVTATRIARNYARRNGGYISDERMNTTSYRKENRFTIRVPQTHFDTLLDSISGISEAIETKNITTVDVTEEYIDIQSRLRTKKEVKERYESILRGKAKTVKEVLLAEEKIRKLQEEIEAAEGKLRYMSNKITFSTIQLDFYEELPIEELSIDEGPTFFSKVKDGLSFGLSMIENVVLLLVHIWPVTIAGIFLGVFLYRRRKTKK